MLAGSWRGPRYAAISNGLKRLRNAALWPWLAGAVLVIPLAAPKGAALTNSRYQLDFTIPGIMPFDARSRKQIRQMPNLRMKARGRPQLRQRLYARVENLGLRFAFSFRAVFAT